MNHATSAPQRWILRNPDHPDDHPDRWIEFSVSSDNRIQVNAHRRDIYKSMMLVGGSNVKSTTMPREDAVSLWKYLVSSGWQRYS